LRGTMQQPEIEKRFNWNSYVLTAEAARLLDISTTRVRELVEEGRLESVRMTPKGWLRISTPSIERLLSKMERR
jgi:excisionase family DNA binding protein